MSSVLSAALLSFAVGTLVLLVLVLVIAGQLSMALLLDHFGWAGFRQALIVAGIWLIRRG